MAFVRDPSRAPPHSASLGSGSAIFVWILEEHVNREAARRLLVIGNMKLARDV